MRRSNRLLVVICLLAFAIGSISKAESEGEGQSKWGFDLEAYNIHQGGYGGLAGGFRSLNYFGHSRINWGYQVFVGSSQGILSVSNTDHLYTGGLSLGTDGLITKNTTYELNFVTGYGDGNVSAQSLSVRGMFISPEVGAGFLLGYGWRTTLNIGYLYFPQGPGFSGLTIGIRIDRKTLTTATGLDR